MENENDYSELIGEYRGYGINNIKVEPEFNQNKKIELPKTFKDVVIKMFPEIQDVVSAGYRETVVYNPETFDPIKKYLVGIDLYFDDKYGMKKSKNEYGKELTDYFKMTYGELDFVTLHVRSFIFPPEKSNEEKFLKYLVNRKNNKLIYKTMGQKIKVIEPTSEVSFIITKQFEVETENGDQYLCQIVDSNKFGEQEFLYKPKGSDDYEGHWGQDNDYPEDVQELGEKLLENFWNGWFDEEGEFDSDELEN